VIGEKITLVEMRSSGPRRLVGLLRGLPMHASCGDRRGALAGSGPAVGSGAGVYLPGPGAAAAQISDRCSNRPRWNGRIDPWDRESLETMPSQAAN
jgi:hypothetical protein